jgi:hypothetical protein
MPTAQQHVDQWKHNRKFIATIGSDFRDWQINVIFYTALHAIDSALATLGVTVSDHMDRNLQVKNNASFTTVRVPYLDLYRISRITRYDAEPDQWIPKQFITVDDMVQQLLRPIENGVEIITKSAIKFRPINLKS